MSLQTLPIEIEFSASQIATKYYPIARFKLTPKALNLIELSIEFKAYYHEYYCPKNSSSNEDYQMNAIDFDLWFGGDVLSLSSFWRRNLLTLIYQGKSAFTWMNEDGEIISCPYPDGVKFENMADEFYSLLSDHLSN